MEDLGLAPSRPIAARTDSSRDLVPRHQDNLHAHGRQSPCDGLTDTPGGSRYNRNL